MNVTLPLFAKSLVVSLPMPVLAPVTITVLPSSRAMEDHWPKKSALTQQDDCHNLFHATELAKHAMQHRK